MTMTPKDLKDDHDDLTRKFQLKCQKFIANHAIQRGDYEICYLNIYMKFSNEKY